MEGMGLIISQRTIQVVSWQVGSVSASALPWGGKSLGPILTPPGARPRIRGYRRRLPAWPSSKAISQWGEERWAESPG